MGKAEARPRRVWVDRSERGANPILAGIGLGISLLILLGFAWTIARKSLSSSLTMTFVEAKGFRDSKDLPVVNLKVQIDYKEAGSVDSDLQCGLDGTAFKNHQTAPGGVVGKQNIVMSIVPGEAGKDLKDQLTIKCSLVRNNDVVDSASMAVNIPKSGQPPAVDTDLEGNYLLTFTPLSCSEQGLKTTITVQAATPPKDGVLVISNLANYQEIPIGPDLSWIAHMEQGIEDPWFYGDLSGRFIREATTVRVEGTYDRPFKEGFGSACKFSLTGAKQAA